MTLVLASLLLEINPEPQPQNEREVTPQSLELAED
jgi:hypothetical protein